MRMMTRMTMKMMRKKTRKTKTKTKKAKSHHNSYTRLASARRRTILLPKHLKRLLL